MIAVFVVTKERLHDELVKAGFQATDVKTETHTIWKNDKNEALSVNHTEIAFPAGYLAELLGAYGVSATFQGEIIHEKNFSITKK